MVYVDEKTKKMTGIVCDVCGKVYQRKFTYYSGKFDLVEVNADLQKTGTLNVDRRFLDIDICIDCYNELIRDNMLKIIEKHKGEKSGKS